MVQDIEKSPIASIKSASSTSTTDISDLQSSDVVLNKKMKLVQDAIDEIGFTPYHLKLLFLNGMGYATDSQLLMIESSVRQYINFQFGQDFPISNEAMVIGGIAGACLFGFSADLIGRRLAFNISLFLSGLFCIITGAMNSLATYCLFVALSSLCFGGNLVLDTVCFLEFLPFKNNLQSLVTLLAAFWGIGQSVAVLIAWAFLPNNSCEGPENCDSADNRGWRYTWYVNGAIVLVLAVARVTVISLEETPKFLVSNSRDEEAYQSLKNIADKYNRPMSLTLEKLQACGEITANEDYRKNQSVKGTLKLMGEHLSVLFSNKTMIRHTSLLFLSWLILGICYPIFYAFLPTYLATRGVNISADTVYGVYRDNVISNVCSIGGPIIAWLLLFYVPVLGRRGVLFIGAIASSAFFFGYTQIKNHAQNVALSSAAYCALYIYFGCLYAFSPETMPAMARATGNACCIMITRFGQIFSPIIAYYSDTSSSAPLFVCGALIAINGIIALGFPLEPSKNRPS
ncbi:putative MFS siderochrome iron transporter 1 [[Candida] jaroonii]|uniref:MFS siderochrome iron transporter 1 n=1 Tax=[Candida] jaroonii TaxID=467808 RepID=A0ACA9Y1Z3_9ASCO|nr:putative MFS siderochrome iron transporter 1 [[Candida] jaroonii]